MEPRVAIILPVYNAASTLIEAINSISNQTFTQYELIIVDDGSADSSYELSIKAARRDSRIRVLRKDHSGLPLTLNIGVSEARAQYIARMDADDLMHPERLSRQMEYLDRYPETDLVSCQVELFPEQMVTDGFKRYVDWVHRSLTHDEIFFDLLRESPLPHPSVMFRSKVIDRIGGYRDFDGPEDYDLWIRMAMAGMQFARLPETQLSWRVADTSLSRSSGRYRAEAFRRLSWEFLLHYITRMISQLERSQPLYICGAGRSGRMLYRFLKEHNVTVSGFVDVDPARIGGKTLEVPVYSVAYLDILKEPPFLLFNVGNWGAVEEFETLMSSLGREPLIDYLVVSS